MEEDENIRRQKFETAIETAIKSGKLNPGGLKDFPDDAAIEVLNVIAPLSRIHGLEAGGYIIQVGKQFHYTKPVVGGQTIGTAFQKDYYLSHAPYRWIDIFKPILS